MPSKSPAQTLLEKADKKANSSSGWFSSSSTKFEEAGDLYQQAANSFKLEKLFREAGDAFSKEAECREKCKETNDAANAWWNAAKAYKRGFPDRALISYSCWAFTEDSPLSSRNSSIVTDCRAFNSGRSLPSGC
jgi:alpha-soluble NSF attachment protein